MSAESCNTLLAKFNPTNQRVLAKIGVNVHTPKRTPKLLDVRNEYGNSVAEQFLRIQIADVFRNLGIEVYDLAKATENIAIAIASNGNRLMMAEWLLVFAELKNSEEIRRQYNQANFVSVLRRKIAEVVTRSALQREKWHKDELDAYLKEIRHQCFALGEISVADFDRLSAEKERELDNKYFNY